MNGKIIAVVCLALGASSCAAESASDGRPVQFERSSGATAEVASRQSNVTQREEPAPSLDRTSVDAAIALRRDSPERPMTLFSAGVRWEERIAAGMTDAQGLGHAQSEALRAYTALIADHPAGRYIAEALFRSAQLCAARNDMTDARRLYLQLIQRFPTSPFIPFAYLSFGDFFTRDAEFESARQFYEQVLHLNPPGELRGYTEYRVSRCFVATQDCARARAYLTRALSHRSDLAADVAAAVDADQAAFASCPQLSAAPTLAVPRAPLTATTSITFEGNPSATAAQP